MLQQVIEAEVEAFLAAHAELEDGHGRRRLVRPSYLVPAIIHLVVVG